MLTRVCLIVVLLVATSLWSQVVGNGAGIGSTSQAGDEDRMLTPSPVDIQGYSVALGSETRSNYLRTGVAFRSEYNDNFYTGVSGNPVSDMSYSIWPTIALDETTPRLRSMLTYSPSLTFYQHSNTPTQLDQIVRANLQYRMSPHMTLSLQDNLARTSNAFTLLNPASVTVAGSIQAPTTPLMFAVGSGDLLSNTAAGEFTYQFTASNMVGASGAFNDVHYPNPLRVQGLNDSTYTAGSAFYTRRVLKKHYLGATYLYQKILTYPTAGQGETQTNGALLFYTTHLTSRVSVSVSGGIQHSEYIQVPSLPVQTWSPAGAASIGWQGVHTTFAVAGSRTISGGGGLVGAYHLITANGSVRRQLTRTWSTSISGSYSLSKNVDSSQLLFNPGGHSVAGAAAVHHVLSEHFNVEVGYARIHQSYIGIAAIVNVPDTNRGWISISYQFIRPLGK